MKNFLNHSDIAINVKNNNFNKALDLYKKKIRIIISLSNDFFELKSFIHSLNVFLYTYFNITTFVDLNDLCYTNLKLIDNSESMDSLLSIGKEIIHSYTVNVQNKTLTENEIINSALKYIRSNLNKKLTLNDISNHVHVNSIYLCQLFSKHTNFKFCEYVNKCKIESAKQILSTSNYSLSIVASKCGFASQSYFSTTFKKYTGLSPNDYKKKHLSL